MPCGLLIPGRARILSDDCKDEQWGPKPDWRTIWLDVGLVVLRATPGIGEVIVSRLADLIAKPSYKINTITALHYALTTSWAPQDREILSMARDRLRQAHGDDDVTTFLDEMLGLYVVPTFQAGLCCDKCLDGPLGFPIDSLRIKLPAGPVTTALASHFGSHDTLCPSCGSNCRRYNMVTEIPEVFIAENTSWAPVYTQEPLSLSIMRLSPLFGAEKVYCSFSVRAVLVRDRDVDFCVIREPGVRNFVLYHLGGLSEIGEEELQRWLAGCAVSIVYVRSEEQKPVPVWHERKWKAEEST